MQPGPSLDHFVAPSHHVRCHPSCLDGRCGIRSQAVSAVLVPEIPRAIRRRNTSAARQCGASVAPPVCSWGLPESEPLRPFSVVGASQIAPSPGSLSNRRSEEDLPGEGGYLRRQGG